MREKPFFTGMSSNDSACTTVVVFDAFRNAQEGGVSVGGNLRESEKYSERRSSYGYVLFPSFSIVGYLNFVVIDGGTNSFECSVHSTGA